MSRHPEVDFKVVIGRTTVSLRYFSNPVAGGYIVDVNDNGRGVPTMVIGVHPQSLKDALAEAFSIIDRLRIENRL